MSYLTPQDTELFSDWEPGWSGQSWFKKGNDGYEWQAYVHGDDDYISFVPVLGRRIPRKLTLKKFQELFND